MSLKNKLLACLGFLGLATLLLIGAFYSSATKSRAALSTVLNDRVVPLKDLKSVADSYAVLIVDSAHKARNGNISFAQASSNVRTGSEQLHAAWKRYRATEIHGEEEQLARAAEERMRVADTEVAKLGHILEAQDRPALDSFVRGELYQSIDPVSDAMGKLVDLQITIASDVTNGALGAAHTALLMMIGLAIAAIIVLAGSFYIVTQKVVRPIKQLAAIIGDLAKQSGEAKLPNLTQQDEIGDITRSVDAFLGASVAKERQNAAAAAATQQLVTTSLAEGLSAMAAGDLTRQVSVEFPPAYQTLKTNFNEALAALCELIGSVSGSTASIKTGSGEIAHASEDLARRTESNAASLEETSAALAQIDGRLKASAQAAARTVERTDQAISTVASGRAIASEAVQVMGRVSDSAKGIDSVIEGLDKIAFQTRVLAMNAAVEAGRAGEAGRGFAVVADLVGALAMRSEEEAKQARDQLTATQSDIVTAVEAVQKVDGAFADISGGVGEVHQLVGTMAADNQAQSAAITEISAAVTTMDHSTQQNAAMVEETSAAARNLTSEVTALTEQAARFTISSNSRARSRAEGAAAPAKAQGYAASFKPLPAAAIPALVRSGEDWNEF